MRPVFESAYRHRLPLLLRVPTGCGQDAFRGAHGGSPGPPSVHRSCHDDLTSADLTGRYLLKGRRDRLDGRPADPGRSLSG